MDFDDTQNIFIESDNLLALKVLQKSYAGKIKMIYIDPPYNTGNDFIYHDDFSQSQKDYDIATGTRDTDGQLLKSFKKNSKDNGRYHSNWLSMMLPRLHLAKSLLTDDGVIFISIDDNEQAQLKLLCDEVFGGENFVADLIWQKKYSPQNDAKWFSTMHDYILCYAKNKDIWRPNLLERTDAQNARYSNPDNDERGDWKATDFSVKTYSANYDYPITTPSGRIVNPPPSRSWRTSRENFEKLLADNRVWFGSSGNNVPSIKKFLTEVKQGITPSTILFRENVGDNQEGAKNIRDIFEVPPFDTPKPVRLLDFLIKLSTDKNSIILDFFAGSATTAHAVMQLNSEDNGNRQFIMVQLPELTDENSESYKAGFKTIAEISKERIRRSGAKIKTENPNIDTGFKVFKLSDSNFKEWNDDGDWVNQLAQHINPLIDNAEPINVIYELLLKMGLNLNTKIDNQNGIYHLTDNGKLYIIILDEIDNNQFYDIIKQKPVKTIAFDKIFKDDSQKKNIELQFKDANLSFETI